MYTRKEAQEKAQKFVDFQNNLFIWNDGFNPEIIIYEELMQERDFGWIFFWQVKEVKADFSNVIGGNGPLIVEKETLDVYQMGPGMSVEEYINMYLRDKNALIKLEMNEFGEFDAVNVED